jgi:hypothetical protein
MVEAAEGEYIKWADYEALQRDRDLAVEERDNLRLRIQAVDAEHMDMERQKHKSIEAFLTIEQERDALKRQVEELKKGVHGARP